MEIKIKTRNVQTEIWYTERTIVVPNNLSPSDLEEYIFENQLHSIWYENDESKILSENKNEWKGSPTTDETFQILK